MVPEWRTWEAKDEIRKELQKMNWENPSSVQGKYEEIERKINKVKDEFMERVNKNSKKHTITENTKQFCVKRNALAKKQKKNLKEKIELIEMRKTARKAIKTDIHNYEINAR